jgi:hypothetical protein
VDGSGNVFIADSGNSRIRKVTVSTKKISTVAGGGSVFGDNGPATKAGLSVPYGVALFPPRLPRACTSRTRATNGSAA